jgi:phytoene/squalene synthetase
VNDDTKAGRHYLNLNLLTKAHYANLAKTQYDLSQNTFKQLPKPMQNKQKAAQAMGVIYKHLLQNLLKNNYVKQKMSGWQKVKLLCRLWLAS